MGKSYAQYPSYVSSQPYAPSQYSFYNYSPTDPMTQVNVPNYQYTANSATPWQNWTAQNAPSYGTVGTNAQTADWKWNNYNVAAPTYNSLMSGDYEALGGSQTIQPITLSQVQMQSYKPKLNSFQNAENIQAQQEQALAKEATKTSDTQKTLEEQELERQGYLKKYLDYMYNKSGGRTQLLRDYLA